MKCLIADLKREYRARRPRLTASTIAWATTVFKDYVGIMLDDGFSIGVNTLRSILKGKYVISESTAKGNTLDMVVQFLKYESWAAYEEEKGEQPNLEVIHRDSIFNVITSYNKGFWNALKELPKINTGLFTNFLIHNTRQYHNNCGQLMRLANYGAHVLQGSYHLIEYAGIKWITDRKACVETRESSKINFSYPPVPSHLMIGRKTFAKMDNGLKTNNSRSRNSCIYLVILKSSGWKIGAKYTGQRYDEAEKVLYGNDADTGKPFIELPVWHEDVQREYFSDDDDIFEFKFVDPD